MTRYRIETTRTDYYTYYIEADSEEEAIHEIHSGNADGLYQGLGDETIDSVEIEGEDVEEE